jgi:hypothetical protein
MWEKLISSVVRGNYYVGEVNIICCKRGLLCGRLISPVVRGDYYVREFNIICCKRGLLCGRS